MQDKDTEYYFNKEGNLVFTEAYHLKKGYCCGNGCRHCPYNYKNVPEPVRSRLRKLKAERDVAGDASKNM